MGELPQGGSSDAHGKGRMGSKKQAMKAKSMSVAVSLRESSSKGVKSQQKWSAPLQPQNYIWHTTELLAVDDRSHPSEGAAALCRQTCQFMSLVESRGWHTAQY